MSILYLCKLEKADKGDKSDLVELRSSLLRNFGKTTGYTNQLYIDS